MTRKPSTSPEKPLGPIKRSNPGKAIPRKKEWVGDIEVVDDKPTRREPRVWFKVLKEV